ncbi:hypothetical protein RirG_215010 [Rhizophagus irregularis DAOM 197198w]|uniref:Uncharacterized protein n=1 Tax=Rhizophagus irregularis (strain DAOM 197198w) TaxID=1432141 RepID=A0A015LP90_RHIIW|nr:hypothetical protein RirG_215010 [Rhizophagus irregularis DAOM 197198w]
MEKMELVNVNDNSFDPTPKLKSSPIPILMITAFIVEKNTLNCLFVGKNIAKNMTLIHTWMYISQ